jgi:hypothetical protein
VVSGVKQRQIQGKVKERDRCWVPNAGDDGFQKTNKVLVSKRVGTKLGWTCESSSGHHREQEQEATHVLLPWFDSPKHVTTILCILKPHIPFPLFSVKKNLSFEPHLFDIMP